MYNGTVRAKFGFEFVGNLSLWRLHSRTLASGRLWTERATENKSSVDAFSHRIPPFLLPECLVRTQMDELISKEAEQSRIQLMK